MFYGMEHNMQMIAIGPKTFLQHRRLVLLQRFIAEVRTTAISVLS